MDEIINLFSRLCNRRVKQIYSLPFVTTTSNSKFELPATRQFKIRFKTKRTQLQKNGEPIISATISQTDCGPFGKH